VYSPRERDVQWAEEEWRRRGVDPSAPFVVVDDDGAGVENAARVAEALDRLSTALGFQIALVPSSSALDAAPDHRASRLQALMTRPAVVVESARWTPDQWLALLNRATTVLSRRYRFAIQAVLADTQLVPLPGPSLAEIRDDFDVAVLPEDFDAQSLVAAVTECDRARSIALLRNSRRQLETRAQNNFAWWPQPTREPEERIAMAICDADTAESCPALPRALQVPINGEELSLSLMPPAHTDTDTFVHLRKANVLHMGDVFFNGISRPDAGGACRGDVAIGERDRGSARGANQI
jgi:hypothetical protein